MLEWMLPGQKPELAEVFLIQRSDRPGVVSVTTSHYEDEDYEPGKKYDYTITAARAGSPAIPGAAAALSVTATDRTRPAAPTGLQVVPLGAGVFLSWDANRERDFKEYLVYRSDQSKSIFPPVSINGIPDENYRPGLTYQLTAVDKSGNESERSEPKGVP
jgi:fibronectin type 3 domain-containing protein